MRTLIAAGLVAGMLIAASAAHADAEKRAYCAHLASIARTVAADVRVGKIKTYDEMQNEILRLDYTADHLSAVHGDILMLIAQGHVDAETAYPAVYEGCMRSRNIVIY